MSALPAPSSLEAMSGDAVAAPVDPNGGAATTLSSPPLPPPPGATWKSNQKFAKDVYIELAAFSDSIYERGKQAADDGTRSSNKIKQ